MARPLYAEDPFGVDLEYNVDAFDATTIDVSLSLCQWAPHTNSRGAVKMHTLLDLRVGNSFQPRHFLSGLGRDGFGKDPQSAGTPPTTFHDHS